jgi:hypothetical protein
MAIRRPPTTFSDTISTADIADDAISGDKLANDIAISTTGNIATTGSGTLTAAGAFTASGGIANAGTITAGTLGSSVVVPASIGGSEVLLNTYTANNSSNIIAITGMTTTYNTYKFVVTGLKPATDSIHVYWFLKNASGTVRSDSYRSSSYQSYYNGSGSGHQNNNTGDSLFGLESDLGNDCEYNGVFYVFNPAAAMRTHGQGIVNYQNQDAYNKQLSLGGHNEGYVEAHPSINLQTESGNWVSGTVRMYGIK